MTVTMGTIEEEIQKRAQSKRGLDGKVIQAGMVRVILPVVSSAPEMWGVACSF